jgi:hypothetical protein
LRMEAKISRRIPPSRMVGSLSKASDMVKRLKEKRMVAASCYASFPISESSLCAGEKISSFSA